MTSEAERVEEVVKGLTKAQREAVLKCRDEWLNAAEIGASGAVLTALCWRWPDGPIAPPVCLLSRDYKDSPLRYIYRLTADGLAVRAHLLAKEGRP
jgi:hypothetical protein